MFGLRKSRGQVLGALNFFPKQDLYYANIWTTLQHLVSIAWTTVIADMPLSGAYNRKMAAIRLILTAEYEKLGPN